MRSHTIKLWECVIEGRLRVEIRILENQFGFMLGKLTAKAIHLMRRLMKLYRDRQNYLHMVFINLGKMYDKVPREVLSRCLERRAVAVAYEFLRICTLE